MQSTRAAGLTVEIDRPNYADRFRSIRLDRRDGILQVTLHHDGNAARWSARAPGGIHQELGDAFYEIGRDRDNRVIILTGTGDEFLTQFDEWMPTPDQLDTQYWDHIYKEGKALLHNLLDIEVPVIGVANGPAFIHAELLTLSDLVIASERAVFADKAHTMLGAVPGDGAHIWWTMLLGPNRGRQFLLTGEEIDAREAKQLGFVAEVVAHGEVLDRAWTLARGLAEKTDLMLRMTRASLTQHIKRRMLDDLGYGLMLEGLCALGRAGK